MTIIFILCFIFLIQIVGYKINQMSKTHPFVHSLKYINFKLDEKYNIYTSHLDQTHEDKLKLSDTIFAYNIELIILNLMDPKKITTYLFHFILKYQYTKKQTFFFPNYTYLYNRIRISTKIVLTIQRV